MANSITSEQDAVLELQCFDALFEDLVNDVLCSKVIKSHETKMANNWFKEVMFYNIPFGKKTRGLSVVTSLKHLKKDCNNEEIKQARILGWCIEWIQGFFLIADDIMDSSATRRGNQCWYAKKEVGVKAINDAFFLNSAVFIILRKYFGSHPYYVNILHLFQDVISKTIMGQCLDLLTVPSDGVLDFSLCTSEHYMSIAKWKTAFYSFYLPVSVAMFLVGIEDDETHMSAMDILLQMGVFFQIQDDFLDCFGLPSTVGKTGTDIQEGKCSWLLVTALIEASPEQRRILEDNYGRSDEDCVNRVRALYQLLDLPNIYAKYEESSFNKMTTMIKNSLCSIPSEIFKDFLSKIYKRTR